MRRTQVDRGLTCRELVELVSDHLEGALPAGDRERFEAHLAACGGCDAFVEQVRTTIRLMDRTRDLEQRPEIEGLVAIFREHRTS